MPSLFPGMDPYIEQRWRNAHSRLIVYAADQLQAQLPDDLRAYSEERVFLEAPTGRNRTIYPDVYTVQRPTDRLGEPGVAMVAEPVVLRFDRDAITERYIQIQEKGGGRVITVLEFLSPTNKLPGPGMDKYLEKQQDVLSSPTSLVEVDLVRVGKRIVAIPDGYLPRDCQTTYLACVRRGWRPYEAEVYPISLRDRLPTIRIPLREMDQDATLDLQSLVDLCYVNGGYEGAIDYTEPPDPPFDEEDAAWVARLHAEPASTAAR